MIVDDRLDTVLRTPAAGVVAARIRLRQLVDLLGRLPDAEWSDQHRAALVRLDQFAQDIPEVDCVRVIETAMLRSRILLRHLAGGEARIAGAAIAAARLTEAEWLDLVPELPMRARGFLRHRRDLGPDVQRLLERFGVADFALPDPASFAEPVAQAPEAELATPAQAAAEAPVTAPTTAPITLATPSPPAPSSAAVFERLTGRVTGSVEQVASDPQLPVEEPPLTGIGAIVRRIEAFRQARNAAAQESARNDPRLPFGDEPDSAQPRITEIQFRTDAEGMIVWADGAGQDLLWGHAPFTAEPDSPARCDFGSLRAMRARTPIRAGRLDIDGVDAIRGAWRVDAIPLFADKGGRFTGYLGRLRRPRHEAVAPPAHDADRLRQLLHELRTPVNAIQGFAELIQQQIFGPTPHEYRSLAASIASDAARILGGFDDIERLVKLETGALSPEPGMAELGPIFDRLMAQLGQVVSPREVRLKVERSPGTLPTALDPLELERLVWRILAVIGSAAQPGERLRFSLVAEGQGYTLSLPLPAALAQRNDDELFAPDGSGTSALAATAMLGSGFALRLAVAEARGAGGSLHREGGRLMLSLPHAQESAGFTGPVSQASPGNPEPTGANRLAKPQMGD